MRQPRFPTKRTGCILKKILNNRSHWYRRSGNKVIALGAFLWRGISRLRKGTSFCSHRFSTRGIEGPPGNTGDLYETLEGHIQSIYRQDSISQKGKIPHQEEWHTISVKLLTACLQRKWRKLEYDKLGIWMENIWATWDLLVTLSCLVRRAIRNAEVGALGNLRSKDADEY